MTELEKLQRKLNDAVSALHSIADAPVSGSDFDIQWAAKIASETLEQLFPDKGDEPDRCIGCNAPEYEVSLIDFGNGPICEECHNENS